MQAERFSMRKRASSFYYAADGIVRFFRTEHNAWVHLAATIGVGILGFIYGVTSLETVLLVFSIGFVWAAEIFNTCIEKIMDFISTEKRPEIRVIKDMSAGAVLIAAITALIIGLIVFVPKIF